MITELRNRFAAHKRRYGRLPRSWTLSEQRFERLLSAATRNRNALADDTFAWLGIRVHGVIVTRRPTQYAILRTSIPAGAWRQPRL